MIAIIAAHDRNNAIGKADRIPWRLAHDRVWLKELTLGNVVILGRKSYDSMVWYYDRSGRPMPGKTYIVVTRNPHYTATRDNYRVASSPEDALKQAKTLGQNVYVIGGERIFNALLPMADKLYITEVDAEIDADSYFPELNKDEWTEVSRKHFGKDDKNEYESDQVVLDRKH